MTTAAGRSDDLKRLYGPDMDGPEHEASYRGFVSFTEAATLTVLIWVMCLAVGGIKHAWGWALVGVVLSFVAAAVSAAMSEKRWKAPATILAFMAVVFVLA